MSRANVDERGLKQALSGGEQTKGCEYGEYRSGRMKEHTAWRETDKVNLSSTKTNKKGEKDTLSRDKEAKEGMIMVTTDEEGQKHTPTGEADQGGCEHGQHR